MAGLFCEGDPDWLNRQIELYGECYEKLKQHDADFPQTSQLKASVGASEVDRLVALLLAQREERLHLLGWSGSETIAKAVAKIEKLHADKVAAVSKNTRIHLVGEPGQEIFDVAKRWSKLEILMSKVQTAALDEGWKETVPENSRGTLKAGWMYQHILEGHGPLCSSYEAHGDHETGFEPGDFFAEPASLTFLHLLPNGLGSSVHPTFGGWGGRFEKVPGYENLWKDAADDGDVHKPVWRWLTHIQGDWSVRADWCVRDYSAANHGPVPVINGRGGGTVLGMKAQVGDVIQLDASATTDPDAQRVAKAWWYYAAPSTYDDPVDVNRSMVDKLNFKVPFDTKPRTHHIMLTVRDGGIPAMFAYRRIVVQAAAGEDTTRPSKGPVLSGKTLSPSRISLSWTTPEDPESGIRRYQLFRDGKVLKELTELRFVDDSLTEATTASYHVVALNGALLESPKSNVITLKTPGDETAPLMINVKVASAGLTLTFDELLAKNSAEMTSNYGLTGEAKVLSAKLGEDAKTVTLTTSPLPLNREPCLLTVMGVQDRAETPNAVDLGTSYLFLHSEEE